MKLKSITFDRFKNLDKEFHFERNSGYIALIGLNGSGKSNLLEAITLLFAHTMGIDLKNFPFLHYILTYDINGKSIHITEGNTIKTGAVTNNDIPSSVIACYSGEDKRLWNSGFKDYYVNFFNSAIKGGDYKPQILYINKYCWKIAFISLLFSEDECVKQFIAETLHITINTVKVRFTTIENGKVIQNHDASNWYRRVENIYNGSDISINELTGDENIELNCTKYPALTNAQIIFYYLYFLHLPDKQGKLGLVADKLIETIDISVNGYSFDDLSEGEKKLILIECITKVLGDENTLVLLDEPDAHTHIALKKDLLKLISEFEGQTIFTTHSPMFVKMINDHTQDNLYFIENGKVTESRNNLIRKLSSDTLTVLDGTLYSTSNSYLLVEGKSDVNCIKAAIEKFPEYKKLRNVSIISFNGSDEAQVFFEQAFQPSMECVNKVVFLFDYDNAGLKASKQIEAIEQAYPDKCYRLFYRKNYDVVDIPASIDNSSSILLEDLVSPDAYHAEIERIHSIASFHQLHVSGNITEKPIKKYIEKNCKSFSQEQLSDFEPLLKKLYSIFDL